MSRSCMLLPIAPPVHSQCSCTRQALQCGVPQALLAPRRSPLLARMVNHEDDHESQIADHVGLPEEQGRGVVWLVFVGALLFDQS